MVIIFHQLWLKLGDLYSTFVLYWLFVYFTYDSSFSVISWNLGNERVWRNVGDATELLNNVLSGQSASQWIWQCGSVSAVDASRRNSTDSRFVVVVVW